MRDFIKEKKGIIGFILVALSFFFITVFLFTKAGPTPDRIINVLETNEADIVSRDTYQAFKGAADAYKLNEEEDPATRHMRAFIEKEKKAQARDDKDAKKDQKETEDHGRNLAYILPFDAKTLQQLNLKRIYTSAEDGPQRAALMRIIQDVAHPLTPQELEGLGVFFAQHKNTISSTEKDDIRKIIAFITAHKGIRAYQKILKQQATSWVDVLQQALVADMAELSKFFKNNMSASLNKFFEGFGDWLRATYFTRILDRMVGLLTFILAKALYFTSNLVSLLAALPYLLWKEREDQKSIWFAPFDQFKQGFQETSISDSLLLYPLFIGSRFASVIQNNLTLSLSIAAVVLVLGGIVTLYLYKKRGYKSHVLTMLGSLFPALGVLGYAIILHSEADYKPVKVGQVFPPMKKEPKHPREYLRYGLYRLYYFLNKGGLLKSAIIGSIINLIKIAIQVYQDWSGAFEGALFLNRLKRITKKMEDLNKSYGQNKVKLPYFEDIATFLNDKTTPAYALVTQAPMENYIRENVSAMHYGIFRDLHHDIDKVLKDQKYKKALASFLVLYKMTNQVASEKDYTLLQKATEDEKQIANPRLHIEHLRPFVAKQKAADKRTNEASNPASENKAKDNKPPLVYDVNIGHKSRAYLLVGDDETVMTDYVTCIGENVMYTQNIGIIRGKNEHYTACDKIFYADGYQDTREAHAARLANVMTYAKQHKDEKILILVSNIASKMSGEKHAAFVHSYASELKKLANVTFVFSTNNVQPMYQVIDMQKTHFTLLTPLLKDQKATGRITIGRSEGHVKGIKMSPQVAKKFRNLLKKNPNYKGHLQDHVTKDHRSSILFLIIMIFMVLGLMLFVKRKK